MKTTTIICFSMFALAAITIGCKTKPPVAGETAVKNIPFDEKEYQTNKNFFRAKQSGNSPDLPTSKKIALQNANGELAGAIQKFEKSVTDQYTNQRKMDDRTDFENKFEELLRTSVNQTLTDVRTIGEKLYTEKNGSYTYWVAVETSKEDILNGINQNISKNQKLQLDYDKKKFEEIFNSEMEKFEKER
jgi:hypothetical protein